MTNANHKRNISLTASNLSSPFTEMEGCFFRKEDLFYRLFVYRKGDRIEMEARDLLFALHETKGVGWKTIETLFLSVSPFEALCNMTSRDLIELGISPAKAETIVHHLNESYVKERKKAYRQHGISFMTVFDRNYPER